ncbi:phage tail tape measure protein [Paracoccus sp. (in: a-proteobacteria)]|uniref:phage tail tape measure protein n=1 Tax=Paracoccus sp. TaxID=267 RepID=UPI002B001D37|nr:phage tail tape measure protein [Paracoccus sp. (in: a-proteobacteria)]
MANSVSELIIRLKDGVSGPAKGAAGALGTLDKATKGLGRGASGEMQKLANALKQAQAQASQFSLFQKLRADLPKLRQDFNSAQDKVRALAREMASTDAPTRKMASAMKSAQAAVKSASAAYEAQQKAVLNARAALQQGGIATDRLGAANDKVKAAITQATAAIRAQEAAEKRAARVAETMAAKRVAAARKVEAAQRQAALAAEQAAHRAQVRQERWAAAVGVGTGTVVAGRMLAQPVSKAMTYDQRLTYVASTMAGDGSLEDKRAAKGRVSDTVDDAVRRGGGTREGAANALNTLVSSGTLEGDLPLKVLPDVVKTAHAAGADPEDIAKMTVAMLNNGVKPEDLGLAFDKAFKAGQLGGVELRDMARWFPQQMAMARGSGLSGMQAVDWLSAGNQVALANAGSPDEAANNLVNLLQKFNSRELQKTMADAVKPRPGDPTIQAEMEVKRGRDKGKKKVVDTGEFDWQGYAIERQKAGVSAPEAFAELLDRQLEDNVRYQELLKQAAEAKNTADQKAALDAALLIAEGSEIGKILADRQALSGALALRVGRERIKQLEAELAKAGGTVDRESAFVREQTWSRAQDGKNTLDRANEGAYGAVSGPLGSLIDGVNEAARAFPVLSSAVYGAGQVIGAIATGGVVGSVVGGLAAGKAAGAAAGAGAAASGAAAGGTGGALVGAGALVAKGGALALPLALGGSTAKNSYTSADDAGRLAQRSATSKAAADWNSMSPAERAARIEAARAGVPYKAQLGALGTIPSGDATLGSVGRFSPDRDLANTSTSRGFVNEPAALKGASGAVSNVSVAPVQPVQMDGALLDSAPIRSAAQAAGSEAGAAFETEMNAAFARVQATGAAAAASLRNAFSFSVTPTVNMPALPSGWGAGGGRAVQADTGLGTE